MKRGLIYRKDSDGKWYIDFSFGKLGIKTYGPYDTEEKARYELSGLIWCHR